MADIAMAAGVSAITVSRALRTPDKVGADLRGKIGAVARELGYIPNHAASSLASARSQTVVVLIPSLTNAVFVDALLGVQQVLDPAGYQILIGNTRYAQEEEDRLLRTFMAFDPDGLLLTGLDHSPATWDLLTRARVPVVHMMELAEREDCYSVGLSQFDAGREMTRHLLARGHRRIGFIAAQLDPRALRRADGYRAALAEAGLSSAGRELLVPQPSSIALGAELLDSVLAQAPDCDALFFCNDDLAQGAIFQCRRRGIAVPGDLSICGFNDLATSAWTNPTLTTVATPLREIGTEAARTLRVLMGGGTPADRHLDLGFRVVRRESA